MVADQPTKPNTQMWFNVNQNMRGVLMKYFELHHDLIPCNRLHCARLHYELQH